MSSLDQHPLFAAPYRRGVADGRAYSQQPSGSDFEDRPAEDDGLLWDLLVKSPFGEEAEALVELGEVRDRLPALERRAYAEGFTQGMRDAVGERVQERLKPPKRWAAVLRQSGRTDLEAMLLVLGGSQTWGEFLSRSLAEAAAIRTRSARRAGCCGARSPGR